MTEASKPLLTPDEERALVERLQRGDPSALEPLWRAWAELVYAAVIFPRLPQRDRAEEVLQQTFLKAWERIQTFTWQENGLLPWIKTIARNLVMDVHRRDQRGERLNQGFAHHQEQDAADWQRPQTRPDHLLAEREALDLRRQRVREILTDERLNERYRRAIELRLFDEREREECAALLEVKVGTFDVLLHRALKRFQQLYVERYGEEGDALEG